MDSKKEIQHVYLVGAKSLGAYGGYETFVYKLTEYHQNKENIKYHVACKANGDGCMDESKFEGVTKINDHEFEFHNSVVLIPNTFMWWIMNSSDRVMVTYMIGAAANGIYAVSYKLPTLVSTLTGIFNQASSA